jgi:hypothetical protein
VDDNETAAYLRERVGAEHGLSAAQSRRLRGTTVAELHADAKAMAKELDVIDPSERARDQGGRFTGSENVAINEAIRQASGR